MSRRMIIAEALMHSGMNDDDMNEGRVLVVGKDELGVESGSLSEGDPVKFIITGKVIEKLRNDMKIEVFYVKNYEEEKESGSQVVVPTPAPSA